MKKYLLIALLSIQSISYAQYLNVDFVEGELDPTPLVKNMGEPPKGIDEAKVRSDLLTRHNMEIGAGLGELAGKVWRIGLMGYNSNEKLVDFCVDALTDVLKK